MNTTQHQPVKRTAFFRFYEELNDFLPGEKRKKMFSHEFRGKSGIKDIIESLGPPHTAIDLILVDGVSVGFDFPLQGGEHVSVYPEFEALDITPLVRLRSSPLRNPKFIADTNLGKLAKKLRLLGIDTLYRNDTRNSVLIALSLKEKPTSSPGTEVS